MLGVSNIRGGGRGSYEREGMNQPPTPNVKYVLQHLRFEHLISGAVEVVNISLEEL